MRKFDFWKCPKCKSINEDFYSVCDCGYENFHKKKKPAKDLLSTDEVFFLEEPFDGFN